MEHPRARPRFAFEHPLDPDEVVARVRGHLAVPGAHVTGRVFERTVWLTLVEERRHFWTPHLDLHVDAAAGGGARVAGTFAPHPQLWGAFLVAQLLFALLSLGLAIYCVSLWQLGHDLGWAPVALIGALIGGGLAYGTAYIGQGLGSEQMYELRSFLDAALREPAAAHDDDGDGDDDDGGDDDHDHDHDHHDA